MKKKMGLSALIIFAILFSFGLGAIAAPKLTLLFNNKQQKIDVRIINNQPYVPLYSIVGLFGGKVTYEKKTNRYQVTSKDFNPHPSQAKSYTVNVMGASGPMKITINKVTVDPAYKYDPYLPPIKAVVLDVVVENTSSAKISWHPAQGIFALNTGEQIEDALLYSQNVSGDFLGHTVKKGKIALPVHGDLERVRMVKCYIHAAFDEQLQPVGEDLSLEIPFR
ncbi:hypothetical protein EP10_001403 [Geobacillus icigianus]|nr:hypothetical protein [Geobacillus icigianus]